jgi:SAM-dependent MidA family methyltransferase
MTAVEMPSRQDNASGARIDDVRRLRALRERIDRALARRGRLTFAAFMQLALYTPGLGYYAAGAARIGAAGDFVTSPEVHPAFAALVARQVAECWELLGRPASFTVVELGGGRGRFAADFWAALDAEHASLAAGVRYVLVDPAPGPRPPRVERRRLPVVVETGCVLANEVFDALPTHLVERRGGALGEVYVVARDGRLVEELGPLSRPALRRALAASGVELAEGQRVEVCLAAPALIARVARVLRCGYVLAFDYGALDWAAHVARRPRGTLRTTAGHAPAGTPLDAPGEQDITYDVDFGALCRAAEATGLAVIGVTTQHAFLARLGWRAYLAALAHRARHATYEANAHALRYLIKPGGLGDFIVLGLATGGAPKTLSGFTPDSCIERDLLARAARGQLAVPLLTADHAPLWAARRPAMPDFAALWDDLRSGSAEA